jgi:adenylosuccinate lyase
MTSSLTAISPLDGRYSQQTAPLQHIMSEFGLIHHRVIVEIDWLITLARHPEIKEIPDLQPNQLQYLHRIINELNTSDVIRIKEIEKTTNHDVKAIEYYLQEQFKNGPSLESYIPFIHFGCTSGDINNVAYALMMKKAREEILVPKLTEILLTLDEMANDYARIPMVSRTHGQHATPTTLGKEVRNFEQRLQHQLQTLQHVPIKAKFNGAVGNFNAHHAAYSNIDWPNLSKHFIEALGLSHNAYTTQIEPHDSIAELMHSIMRTNTILVDLARDFWGYISHDYFTQIKVAGEVGSSTMPHKVNPINFENAEGNLGLANAIASHLADKLPISRWQRDLTDSTVMRNIGTIFGYCLISYRSLEKGLAKLKLNEPAVTADLAERWELIAEPIQTVLRRFGIPDAYEQLKDLSRGKKLTEKDIKKFIKGLDVPQEVKDEITEITPCSYIGYAVEFAHKKH